MAVIAASLAAQLVLAGCSLELPSPGSGQGQGPNGSATQQNNPDTQQTGSDTQQNGSAQQYCSADQGTEMASSDGSEVHLCVSGTFTDQSVVNLTLTGMVNPQGLDANDPSYTKTFSAKIFMVDYSDFPVDCKSNYQDEFTLLSNNQGKVFNLVPGASSVTLDNSQPFTWTTQSTLSVTGHGQILYCSYLVWVIDSVVTASVMADY
ncbi:MAG: hypothetical protein FWF25_07710 [Propionibacteriaceae bacterium]|nr:hypothetical protein [Propionibacteriaceae bacterium]